MTFKEWAERWYNERNTIKLDSYDNDERKKIIQNLYTGLTHRINLLFNIDCTIKRLYLFRMSYSDKDVPESKRKVFTKKMVQLEERKKELKLELKQKEKDYIEAQKRNSPLLERKLIKISNLKKRILKSQQKTVTIWDAYEKNFRFKSITDIEADFYDFLMDLIVKRNEEGKNVYTMFDNNQLDLIPKEKRELFCKKLMQFSEQMEINWSDLLYNSIVELNNKLIDPVYYRVIANLRTIKSYVTDNCGNNVIYEYDEKLLAEIDKKTKIIVRNIKKTERIKEKEGLYYYI